MLLETLPSGRARQENSPALVRVVDDEPAIQALFRRIGDLCGFVVECHDTAQSLLANIDESAPGCLVLDLMLPDRSGIDVLQDLTQRGCKLPVVFMSCRFRKLWHQPFRKLWHSPGEEAPASVSIS